MGPRKDGNASQHQGRQSTEVLFVCLFVCFLLIFILRAKG